MENPRYTLTICFTDNETTDVFADNVLFHDNYINIKRQSVDGADCVMIVPFSSIKYLLSKRFKG